MDLFPIRNDCDHRRALDRFSSLADPEPEPGSAQEATLEALAILIDAYERKRYPLEQPDPIDYLKFEMDRRDLSVSDLVPFYRPTKSCVLDVIWQKRAEYPDDSQTSPRFGYSA
jgi:HTH-type transcriptional regulator/antitoxin HigA